ncbi:MAG TPA: hypothetical protein VI172_14760 [Candidatus Dormibacteraeota bacterium]|jgi:hypothetical protein
MTTVELKRAEKHTNQISGGHLWLFEAAVDGMGEVPMPNATITPTSAEGALAPDGAVVWLRLIGPVAGGDPRHRANWEWTTRSATFERRPEGMPTAVQELAGMLRAAVVPS